MAIKTKAATEQAAAPRLGDSCTSDARQQGFAPYAAPHGQEESDGQASTPWERYACRKDDTSIHPDLRSKFDRHIQSDHCLALVRDAGMTSRTPRGDVLSAMHDSAPGHAPYVSAPIFACARPVSFETPDHLDCGDTSLSLGLGALREISRRFDACAHDTRAPRASFSDVLLGGIRRALIRMRPVSQRLQYATICCRQKASLCAPANRRGYRRSFPLCGLLHRHLRRFFGKPCIRHEARYGFSDRVRIPALASSPCTLSTSSLGYDPGQTSDLQSGGSRSGRLQPRRGFLLPIIPKNVMFAPFLKGGAS